MKQTELTGTCRVCGRDMAQKETEAPARPVCPESEVILQADHLFFSYDQGRSCALRDLSLKIRRGSKTAFLGANGSGKSTFFLCCNGIHRPTSGTLSFAGKLVGYSRKELLSLRQKVGIVFQDPDSQLFSSSVYQEISFGVMNLGFPEEKARQAVERILDEMELTSLKSRPVHTLSGGQKKQVSIADILVMEPELVILDEPASALDPRHTKLVQEAVKRMTDKGITVMMATHDVDFALDWADEAVVLKDGCVLRQGTPEEIFTDRELLSQANLSVPAALRLFDSLCRKGILDPSLPIPRNLDELESYLA